MSDKKSIWATADNFLTKTRKIIINSVTALVLIVITFSILGGVGSMFSGSDEIDTENKVLWFKPIGVVVDSEVRSGGNIDIDAILGSGVSKLALVLAMSGVHGFLAVCVRNFAQDNNTRKQKFFRYINEIPTLLMIVIVILVIVKPF